MPPSRRRKEFRLHTGVNRKLCVIWWMGCATARVVIGSSSSMKADKGAERSCRPRRRLRGQRKGKCRSRGRHPRSSSASRPLKPVVFPKKYYNEFGTPIIKRNHRYARRAERWFLTRGTYLTDKVIGPAIRKYWVDQCLPTDKENRTRVKSIYFSFALKAVKCGLLEAYIPWHAVLASYKYQPTPSRRGCGHRECWESGFRCDVTEEDFGYISRGKAPPRPLPEEPTPAPVVREFPPEFPDCRCLYYPECQGTCGSQEYKRRFFERKGLARRSARKGR